MPSAPVRRVAALVQLRGAPLAGGVVRGSGQQPLERAAGGDTPVLTFRVAAADRPDSAQSLRLLLDTGASSTMVSPALVARLGLETTPLPAARLGLAGGGEGCERLAPALTRLPTLQLAIPGTSPRADSLSLSGVEALVLPVAALPNGVDGVLGIPTLRLLPIRIDPRQGRITLGQAALEESEAETAGSVRPIRLRWRRGVPLLQLGAPDGPVEALVDTGAEGLFLQPGLAARLRALDAGQRLRLVGVCGDQRVERRRFTGLRLPAEQDQRPIEAIVIVNPIFDQLGVQVIAGQEWLRQRRQLWRLDLTPPQLLLW